jgi:hypothetical protein
MPCSFTIHYRCFDCVCGKHPRACFALLISMTGQNLNSRSWFFGPGMNPFINIPSLQHASMFFRPVDIVESVSQLHTVFTPNRRFTIVHWMKEFNRAVTTLRHIERFDVCSVPISVRLQLCPVRALIIPVV